MKFRQIFHLKNCLPENGGTPDQKIIVLKKTAGQRAVVLGIQKRNGIFKRSRWSPQAATFDRMPGILAVITYPYARFFQEVNIGMPAQGTYNTGLFPFFVVRVFHNAPVWGEFCLWN
jgi:hypothetical protein